MTNSLLDFSSNFSRDFYKAIDDSMILSITDEFWMIKYISKEFCQTFKYSEYELIGKPLLPLLYFQGINTKTKNNLDKLKLELLGIFYLENNELDIENTLKNWQTWKWILKNKVKNGPFVWCKTIIVPILDNEHKTKQYMIIQSDVSDLEIAKQNLKNSFQKLKELDEKKSEFLNIASHELRTPMTAIRWYLSMMLDWDFWELNENIKKYLYKMFENSSKLVDLINDMLDLAKLESSRIDFALDYFDIIELIENIIAEMNPLLHNKNHKLEFNHKWEELFIESDRDKIKHVILNLLSNAIKFTPDSWLIKINCLHDGEMLVVDVIDNWIWINIENQKIIFEKFGQVKNSLTRDISWTWLWLPIVKSTIDRLGWKLELESSEWKWSRFTFKIHTKFI